jgi:large subunit ribosomal protein L21
MYAIVKTGGKQYRVQEGQRLLIERLEAEDGDSVSLVPLLYVDGDKVVDGEAVANINVAAKVLGQERGPKLRVVHFRSKHGFKRRTGYRQDLTRIEISNISLEAN